MPFLLSKKDYFSASNTSFRYKGFLLIKQCNQSWLIRPEKSPLLLLPFRTAICSLEEAKIILDKKLSSITRNLQVA
ncbi:hypothetical protein [Prochlorococcus marinus]|uniref:hypothetical protein n=1 Tax=Prochlorococcus marinus TaxID=1219 RepID=UPI0022B548DB|nr:hypothetical protein [Prochlorococcus marinus]